MDAEPDAAAEIARRCAYLPLALRITAERAAAYPKRTLMRLSEELANEHDRLDVIAAPDDEATAVRTVFSWSYRALRPELARIFRLIGLHAGPTLSTYAAAALADAASAQVRRLLEALTGVHLLEEVNPDHFRFHDLLRAYAAECAHAEEPRDSRTQAVNRVLLWYLHTAAAARVALEADPPERPFELAREFGPRPSPVISFTSQRQALEWCDAELENLVAATRQAAENEQHHIACWLPIVLRPFFQRRMPFDAWLLTYGIGLASSRISNDQLGEAEIHRGLGAVYYYQGHYQDALFHNEKALVKYRQVGRSVKLCSSILVACTLL